ncbi:flavoprotein [Actinoplanes sp. NBRC 103695]|uniref:flavoprotein n=1 Tax=Actinoplanes sp. NBRC 103695 TaxID=3032202 RepID=UPI0024A25D90|nr:flavoprotein [Actinoplanes sp. NBRC 103695]GLZ00756.1 flavoprotein [Actinoplanes sp. NBRC 103695]
MNERILCIVVCGAGPADRVGRLVELAQHDGWTVRLVATPTGAGFVDVDALAAQSGAAVRSGYRAAGESGPRSSTADAVIVAPATYNTINKLAFGINDTYALNVVAEAIGRGRPVVVIPFVNTALATRHPFRNAVRALREEGVRIVFGPGQWEPHEPGTGDERIDSFPWHLALKQICGDWGTRGAP